MSVGRRRGTCRAWGAAALEAAVHLRQSCDLFEREVGEGDEVQAGEGLGQSLIVAGEAAEAGEPAEGALNDPSPGQEHEAALGFE